MASHATLVEASTPASADATAATPSRAADDRPSQLRANSDSMRRPPAEARHEAVSDGTRVVRSESEQTDTGADSPVAKTRLSIMQRFRESLRRQFRSFGTHVMQTHFHESPRGIDGYYSVSLH
ncbi:hypothetical protein H4S01_004178 [Coemansia sp. RSA 2610]|nr:hypothetical protein H4S01_004178 [Coemansia sp. RSA 2610]